MDPIIERGLKANPNMKLTDNKEHIEKILQGIAKKDGHCPCVLAMNEDTICPCKKMREESKCCCKLYIEK
jgi:ferredoxin-thioredoxin reductase catalytic subunit